MERRSAGMGEVVAEGLRLDQIAARRRAARGVVDHPRRVLEVGRDCAAVLLGPARPLVRNSRHQQVVKSHLEAVSLVGAQHQRTRAFVVAQLDVAGCLRNVGVDHRSAIGNPWVAGEDHVALQYVEHARRVEGAVAVKHDRLLERHDFGA